jgi:hypothetical protein
MLGISNRITSLCKILDSSEVSGHSRKFFCKTGPGGRRYSVWKSSELMNLVSKDEGGH